MISKTEASKDEIYSPKKTPARTVRAYIRAGGASIGARSSYVRLQADARSFVDRAGVIEDELGSGGPSRRMPMSLGLKTECGELMSVESL